MKADYDAAMRDLALVKAGRCGWTAKDDQVFLMAHRMGRESAARTPGPATAKYLAWIRSDREVSAHEATRMIVDFLAEWPINDNTPACEDRGGE